MEAAVIVPMIVTITALLLGYCYYVHQINWYKGAAYEAAVTGLKYPENAAEKAKERIDFRAGELPLTVGEERAEVSEGHWVVHIQPETGR